ncbi:hypothetical protein ACWGJ2_09010 [Streptomyces sp. NPDC054796]
MTARGGHGTPPAHLAHTSEPGPPVGADAWDVRSWALLPEPEGPEEDGDGGAASDVEAAFGAVRNGPDPSPERQPLPPEAPVKPPEANEIEPPPLDTDAPPDGAAPSAGARPVHVPREGGASGASADADVSGVGAASGASPVADVPGVGARPVHVPREGGASGASPDADVSGVGARPVHVPRVGAASGASADADVPGVGAASPVADAPREGGTPGAFPVADAPREGGTYSAPLGVDAHVPGEEGAFRAASVKEEAGGPGQRGARSGPADPVRGLMHRYRELCERAVDPLEIAAGLEAYGVTDRTAARFRHRDVFSLAEELYARVPRAEEGPGPAGSSTASRQDGEGQGQDQDEDQEDARGVTARALRALLPALPGALCAATLAATGEPQPFPHPAVRPCVAVVGAVAVAVALRLVLRRVPGTRPMALWVCWLVGYALAGDWLLTQLISGGPDATTSADMRQLTERGRWAVPLGLACAVLPAVWCVRWFAVRVRRTLAGSRSLDEFAAGVRPLLTSTVALFTLALLGVLSAADLAAGGRSLTVAELSGTAALGVLLFAALLLAAHGYAPAASAGLGAACVAQALALVSPLAARLPRLGTVGRPVETFVAVLGPGAVAAVVCLGAALGLLAYAWRALTGASAHHRPAAP